MVTLGHQSLPPTDLGRADEETASPGERPLQHFHERKLLSSIDVSGKTGKVCKTANALYVRGLLVPLTTLKMLLRWKVKTSFKQRRVVNKSNYFAIPPCSPDPPLLRLQDISKTGTSLSGSLIPIC
ncbi:hypothetical protein TNCV_4125451 [Trichonephila clavipes]|nr:hypothetical protein TNCV_4125451 [Trichonephila clavipes]